MLKLLEEFEKRRLEKKTLISNNYETKNKLYLKIEE